MQGAGWIWLLFALGLIALGVAIAYGSSMWRNRRKDPVTRKVQAEVTREHYREP